MTVVVTSGKGARGALVPLGQFETDLIFSVAFINMCKTNFNSVIVKSWLF